MSYQLPHWVWPVVLMTTCAAALFRGRDEERLATAGMLANWAFGMVVYKESSEETQWAVLIFDAALLGLYVWLGMRSPRHWPLFASGFQLLIVLTHMAHMIDARVSGWAYLTAQVVWSYLILFTIIYGSMTTPRRADPAS